MKRERDRGHNRWHPDIEPLLRVANGDTVTVHAPLGTGDQIGPGSTHADLLSVDLSQDVLVGPVHVDGAEPGDLLAVDVLQIEPDDFGFSCIFPGFGVLADVFPDPYLVTWRLDGGHARSDELPGVAIPAAPFPGTIGVAPSQALLDEVTERERELGQRMGVDLDALAAPPIPSTAAAGLGLLPPREIGGNMDTRQLGVGSRIFFPVHVPGALLSLGDMHFAQGEGEVCGTAIEIGAHVTLRFHVVRQPRWRPRFPVYEAAPQRERRYFGTTGISVADDGTNELLDIGLAARRALLELIDYLAATYGFTREASYILASVAADLRISAAVDVPNAFVSALLPLDVFETYRSPS